MSVEIRVLRADDDRAAFSSGDEALDLYFHRYAGQNQFRHHVGVTYVAAERDGILGFVTVAPAQLGADDLPGGRRRPPYPVPVLRIARLATSVSARGRGVGRALLRFTIELAERMRDEVGCVGLTVDAKSEAVSFYGRYGFVPIGLVEGASEIIPAVSPMFLPLGAVPRRR
jgi:GNAT superfamily N-acetyltransferase